MRKPLVFSHTVTALKTSPTITSDTVFTCLIYLLLLVTNWVSLSHSPPPHMLNPLLSSHQINNAEDDALARHLYLPLRLRPPKIRNSPLI